MEGRVQRRDLFRWVLGGATVLVAAGCRPGSEREAGGAALRLDDLQAGERRRVEVDGHPVQVRRDAQGALHAVSLRCTHAGCEVVWKEGEQIYACPCHDGEFDAQGRPRYGPPSRPLRRLPVRVVAGRVRVQP